MDYRRRRVRQGPGRQAVQADQRRREGRQEGVGGQQEACGRAQEGGSCRRGRRGRGRGRGEGGGGEEGRALSHERLNPRAGITGLPRTREILAFPPRYSLFV